MYTTHLACGVLHALSTDPPRWMGEPTMEWLVKWRSVAHLLVSPPSCICKNRKFQFFYNVRKNAPLWGVKWCARHTCPSALENELHILLMAWGARVVACLYDVTFQTALWNLPLWLMPGMRFHATGLLTSFVLNRFRRRDGRRAANTISLVHGTHWKGEITTISAVVTI